MGILQISRVPHHGTSPAAGGAGGFGLGAGRDHLKHLVHRVFVGAEAAAVGLEALSGTTSNAHVRPQELDEINKLLVTVTAVIVCQIC